MRSAHLPSEEETTYPRQVGPARARRLRLLALREALAEPVDVDAVASAIVRRAQFTQQLAGRLREEGVSARSEAL